MFSEKLYNLLSTLTKPERNRFRKYLISPYLNDQPDLVKLFDYCQDVLFPRNAAWESTSREQVWLHLYPQKKYDDAQLRRLTSDLIQLGFKFLIAEKRAQEPKADWLDLQLILDKPQLEKHLNGIEKQLEKAFDADTQKTTEFYLDNFKMRWNVFNRAGRVVASAHYLEKMYSADFFLECFYIIQKLKFYVAWLVYRGFRSSEMSLPLMADFNEYIADKRFEEVPLISIYRKVIACLEVPENELFFKYFLMDLEKFGSKINNEDLREFYHIAQNYCALKLNQGRVEYYQEMFFIFKNMLERDLLLDTEHQLPEGVFKNIITVGLRLGEFDWVEDFVEKYAVFLPDGIRENAKTFNLANIFLQKKQYDKVIRLLRDVEYKDVTYSVGSKLLLLMAYFEMQEFAVLDAQMDSFRIFLRRNKSLSTNAKKEFTNFLNFLNKLNSLAPNDRAARQKLKEKVLECPSVSAKKWLLDQLSSR